jgi:hypothetical protein
MAEEGTFQVHQDMAKVQEGCYSAPCSFIEQLVDESVLRRDGIVLFGFGSVAAAAASLCSNGLN